MMKDAAKATVAIPEFPKSPYEFSGLEECHAHYATMRQCPVHHTEALGGFYSIVRYPDVKAAGLDGKSFSSATKGVLLPADPDSPRLWALEQEGRDHMAAKRLYMEAFAPARLKALEPRLTEIANGLIDVFAGRGSCDLVEDYAHPLPVLGVCAAIGVAGVSVDKIRKVSGDFGKDPSRRREVIAELGGLVMGELMERRANPKDDYLTRVANAELNGRRMDEADLAMFMVGFFTAGHETTSSTLSSLLFHTMQRPDLCKRMMSDDTLLAAAIEETVRLNPPFQAFHRTTTTDVEVSGAVIPTDSTVRLCYGAANRDPVVFDQPDRFDPERQTPGHLGFGVGRHVCAGAPLARLEIKTAFRTLLARLPDIVLTQDKLEYSFSDGVFAAPLHCHASFTPASPV
ncbi:cytochrome P450 [Novosphingobium sp. MMS21-SN21R]|uniref:cytochrome P450 n=1 Tax=Novosphingobium sp. MMS21-SN21R TaxID=2969298 RepID=UPI0028882E5D|nr:cytochrome P450 [Novosphingobium sp. MMS21-SN21R]MDT0510266.1 cytochrome P450 [Novosphingobium sp. MMS21-SN21R]